MATAIVSPAQPHVNGSTHKIERTWDEVFDGTPIDTPARTAWRKAVAEVAARAKAALPAANGRVDAAVKIVLAGDVEPQSDGTAKVASQSNGQAVYHLVNGECPCKDAPKAPQSMCKHRLAYGIYKRATRLVAERFQFSAVSAHKTTRQDGPQSTIVGQDDSPSLPRPRKRP
jgi:hypothetical protein